MRGVNGKLLIAQYKYGDKQNLFESYEKAIALIEQYPILYSILPQEMKDRNMALLFVKANGKAIARYQEILTKIRKEDERKQLEGTMSALSGLHSPYFEEETVLKNNAFVDTMYDLGEFSKDVEILKEAMCAGLNGTWFVDSVGGFLLTPENYDEKTLKEVVKEIPQTICRVYWYWHEYMEQFPKVRESIMVKYGLRNNPSSEELAFFKSLSLIDERKNAEELNHLLQCYTMGADAQINEDHLAEIKSVFLRFPPETQNFLVEGNYRYAQYAKKGILRQDLQEEIAKTCPIAGDILPDSAVIQYNLPQSESNKAAYERCNKCGKCAMHYALFV